MPAWSEPAARRHTFSTGHTAMLDTSLPLMWLAEKARDRGDMDASAAFSAFIGGAATVDTFADLLVLMQRDIVEHAFVEPRVVYDPLDLPDPVPTGADGGPLVVTVRALPDAVIVETVGLVLEGVAEAARFPGDPAGGGGGGDGEVVGAKPKPRPRAKARKP